MRDEKTATLMGFQMKLFTSSATQKFHVKKGEWLQSFKIEWILKQ
jgi:hypothetical protein